MSITTRWRCPKCGDEMSAKFRHTHPAWCALAFRLSRERNKWTRASTVEEFLDAT